MFPFWRAGGERVAPPAISPERALPGETHMHARLTVLENIRVASPCTANWEQMAGDQKTRFCHQCKLNVHNFSAMTEAEVLRLVEKAQQSGSRLCGRFYLRRDGTVLTQDCPVGIAALRRKMARNAGSLAAAVLFVVGLVTFFRQGPARGAGTASTVTQIEPIKSLRSWIAPAAARTPPVLMGDIAWTPPPAGNSAPSNGGSP